MAAYLRSGLHWVAVLTLAAGLPTLAGGVTRAPTIEDIRVAWDKQNTGVIAVRYVIDLSRSLGDSAKPGASAGKTLLEFTYIRTPEMLYEKRLDTGQEKSAERNGNARLGEGRVVEICRGKMQIVDFQKQQLHAVLQARDRAQYVKPGDEMERTWELGGMETILYRMYRRQDDPNTGVLYGWLKYAKIAEGMETVDGHECWKLDTKDTGGKFLQRLQVWLDPAIGYCPRRIVTEGTATGVPGKVGPFKIVDDFADYREISDGIWFPGKHVRVKNQEVAGMVNGIRVSTLNEVYKDRPCSKSDLTLKFEPGTTVYRFVPPTGKPPRDWQSGLEKCVVAEDGAIVAAK